MPIILAPFVYITDAPASLSCKCAPERQKIAEIGEATRPSAKALDAVPVAIIATATSRSKTSRKRASARRV